MGKFQDLSGQKYGRLTVIRQNGRIGKDLAYDCECECGNIKHVSARDLRSGNTKSCGCMKKDKASEFEDLSGKRFGKLTVLRPDGRIGSSIAYMCLCDCGNEKRVSSKCLRRGNTKSCGCLLHNHPKNYKDLTGERFGRLTVVGRSCDTRYGKTSWLCKCDCGNESVVPGCSLKNGSSKSCGCLKKESRTTKHGKSGTRLYAVWTNMKQRCLNPNNHAYEYYGGRGIGICDEWLNDFASFESWCLSNGYDETLPKGECTLDRVNSDGDYEPSNCRFADMKVQINNRRYVKNGCDFAICDDGIYREVKEAV